MLPYKINKAPCGGGSLLLLHTMGRLLANLPDLLQKFGTDVVLLPSLLWAMVGQCVEGDCGFSTGVCTAVVGSPSRPPVRPDPCLEQCTIMSLSAVISGCPLFQWKVGLQDLQGSLPTHIFLWFQQWMAAGWGPLQHRLLLFPPPVNRHIVWIPKGPGRPAPTVIWAFAVPCLRQRVSCL